MSDLIKNIKDYFSTFLGIFCVISAVFSYIGAQFFKLVPEHSIWVDLFVGCFGFVLVFTNPSELAGDILKILKNKIEKI